MLGAGTSRTRRGMPVMSHNQATRLVSPQPPGHSSHLGSSADDRGRGGTWANCAALVGSSRRRRGRSARGGKRMEHGRTCERKDTDGVLACIVVHTPHPHTPIHTHRGPRALSSKKGSRSGSSRVPALESCARMRERVREEGWYRTRVVHQVCVKCVGKNVWQSLLPDSFSSQRPCPPGAQPRAQSTSLSAFLFPAEL
jgi:hypothetical protein